MIREILVIVFAAVILIFGMVFPALSDCLLGPPSSSLSYTFTYDLENIDVGTTHINPDEGLLLDGGIIKDDLLSTSPIKVYANLDPEITGAISPPPWGWPIRRVELDIINYGVSDSFTFSSFAYDTGVLLDKKSIFLNSGQIGTLALSWGVGFADFIVSSQNILPAQSFAIDTIVVTYAPIPPALALFASGIFVICVSGGKGLTKIL